MRKGVISRSGAIVWLMLGVLTMPGCQTLPPASKNVPPGKSLTAEQITNMPLEKNVTQVGAFYEHPDPWIWSEDKSHPVGIFISALYLFGADGKGVFGDGVLRPKLYVSQKQPDGKKSWVVVKEWGYNPEVIMPCRIKKRSIMGWAYGRVPLRWGDMDLTNCEIRLILNYERSDGQVVQHHSRKDFIVPAGGH